MYFLIRRGGCSVCRDNETITPSQLQSLLLTTDQKFHNLQQMKCTFPRDNSNSKSYHFPHDCKTLSQYEPTHKNVAKITDPLGHFRVSDDL